MTSVDGTGVMRFDFCVVVFVLGIFVAAGCAGCTKHVKCVDENTGVHVPCSAETGGGSGGLSGDASATAGGTGNSGSDGATTGGGTSGDGSGTGSGTGNGTGGTTGNVDRQRANSSCKGVCGLEFQNKDACQCDSSCYEYKDCCSDLEKECPNIKPKGTVDGSDGTDGNDGNDGSSGPVGYEFPQPYKVDLLSYNDCKGIASGNYSWCDTFNCKAIAKWDKSWCDGDKSDCKGIASADKSWCGSKDCKALADARKCEKNHKGDADAMEKCKTTARAWCDSYDCKAMTVGYSGDCKSSNCKAIVKGDYSYCFQKRNWD